MSENIKIGDSIELMIEGAPASILTPMDHAKMALSLVRHGIPLGASVTAGIIGGVREASLKIGGEIYRMKYALRALRAITALEVYSEAIEWIQFKKNRGSVDSGLADETIDYLRADLRRLHRKWLK
jgi:hypothetical protein